MMKKYLIGLTAATLLSSPLVFADDMTTTTPSTPSSTNAMPTTTTTSTASDTASTDVQFKTSDGKIIHGQFDSQDLQGMNVGDKLEITDLGTSSSSGSMGATPTSNTSNGTDNSTSNTDDMNGTSSGASNNPSNMNSGTSQ